MGCNRESVGHAPFPTLGWIPRPGYYEEKGKPTIEEDVAFFVEHGMVGMKFKIGGASPATDSERLRRAVKLRQLQMIGSS